MFRARNFAGVPLKSPTIERAYRTMVNTGRKPLGGICGDALSGRLAGGRIPLPMRWGDKQ